MHTKFLKILFFLLVITTTSFAQWTCRSKIGAHLKPIKKDFPLLWAFELTGGHGYMNDRDISNVMMFLGVDYSTKKNQFYFEGGRKAWHNSLGSPEKFDTGHNKKGYFQQRRFGIREAFYKKNNKRSELTLGFQSIRFGDYFLVNERGLGVSYKNSFKDFTIQVNAASVLKDFSRFGSFCSVHYTYNLLRDRNYAYIGENIGETNFAGFVLKWNPSKKANNVKEAGEFNEFSSSDNKKLITETGLIFYNEFGTGIDTISTHCGLMAQWDLPGKMSMKTEVLHQLRTAQQTMIYHVSIFKQFNFGKRGQSMLSIGYFGDYDINKHARPYASFSNLFIGEVMRMDVMDMPLYQFAFKHRYPKWKSQIKLQATQQFTDNHISEYNIAVGKTFFKHAKLTLLCSRINADVLEDIFYMVRAELRITI